MVGSTPEYQGRIPSQNSRRSTMLRSQTFRSVAFLGLCFLAACGSGESAATGEVFGSSTASLEQGQSVQFDVSPPLRDLSSAPVPEDKKQKHEKKVKPLPQV